MRTSAAFLAGLVLGAAGAWLVATHGLLPVAVAPTASPSAAPPPSSPAGAPAGLPSATFPAAPSPSGPELGTTGAASPEPAGDAASWTASPEPEAPLGTRASSIPGDSTDGLLTP